MYIMCVLYDIFSKVMFRGGVGECSRQVYLKKPSIAEHNVANVNLKSTMFFSKGYLLYKKDGGNFERTP